DVESVGDLGQFGRFAGSDVGRGVDVAAIDQFRVDGIGTGGLGEQRQLVQGAPRLFSVITGKDHSDEEPLLARHLQVGDRGGEAATGAAYVRFSHVSLSSTPNPARAFRLDAGRPSIRGTGLHSRRGPTPLRR